MSDVQLVTHAEARTYLQIKDTDKPSDAWLDMVLTSLSDYVIKETGRRYDPTSSDATEQLLIDHDGGPLLEIDDAQQVAKVEIASDADTADWLLLDPSWWVAEPSDRPIKEAVRFLGDLNTWPATQRGWIFGGRQASGLATRTPWPREARAESTIHMVARVTGKFGHGGPTPNARLAILMWLQGIHKRDVAFYSRDLANKQGVPGDVPGDVKALIDAESRTSPAGTVMAV